MNEKNIPQFVTVKQAATALTLCQMTVRLWIDDGKIGHVRLGRRVVIPLEEIQRIAKEGVPPAR